MPLAAKSELLTYSDSVEISLLTCTPGNEVWAQYGHTAIRYNDVANGNDLVVNYGVFSFEQSYFIPRFVLGLTDYSIGISTMEEMLFVYSHEGRGIVEQVLNLTKEEKYKIYLALKKNLLPENVVYRYNFFYDNCTTRAQHMLLDHLSGSTKYISENTKPLPSFREMIHEWNKNDAWTQFGEDILLGVTADLPVKTEEQKLFLPDNLRKYIANAIHNGQPLVKQTSVILQPNKPSGEESIFISPFQVAIVFAVLAISILLIEYKKKMALWGWDILLMAVSSIIGLLLFIMIFSHHPSVSLNMIIFLFNPLALFLIPSVVKSIRHKQNHWWWTAWEVSIIIGFIGGFFQKIPVPVLIVALFLLFNCIFHRWLIKNVYVKTIENKAK
ncbi:DUF4105 domain-containing protein [Prevotella falsenii]